MSFAQLNSPPYGDMLTPLLAGREAGKRITILGNGPSALKYEAQPGDVVIACNNALRVAPDAAYWLVTEGAAHVFPWFWQHTGYKGQVVWDRFISHAAQMLINRYGEDFLSRVCWILRGHLNAEFRLRHYLEPDSTQGGLVQGEYEDQPIGTVVMQAIHLAGIMGAESVDIYGAEFYFPAGEQHADGSKPFKPGDGPTGLIEFDMLEGAPVPVEHGAYQTTRQFFLSAACLCDLIEHVYQEMPVRDHSVGLLSPKLLPRLRDDRAEPGQPGDMAVPEI